MSKTLSDRLHVREVFDQRLSSRSFGSYLRRLSGRGPKKAPARTFPAAMPVLQLDRIYVRGFDIQSAQVLYGPSWARLSDHAPLVAELSLQKTALSARLQTASQGKQHVSREL